MSNKLTKSEKLILRIEVANELLDKKKDPVKLRQINRDLSLSAKKTGLKIEIAEEKPVN